jgi:hypothetical protein
VLPLSLVWSSGARTACTRTYGVCELGAGKELDNVGPAKRDGLLDGLSLRPVEGLAVERVPVGRDDLGLG